MRKIIFVLVILAIVAVACTEEYAVTEPTTPAPQVTPSEQPTAPTASELDALLAEDLDQAVADLDAVEK